MGPGLRGPETDDLGTWGALGRLRESLPHAQGSKYRPKSLHCMVFGLKSLEDMSP